MKRFLPIIVAALAALPGCGYFTNIPAQVVVAEVKAASLVYGEGTTANSIKIDSPEAVLRTDPGSVGVTFNSINVTYYKIDGTAVAATDLPPLKLGMTCHVDGSQYPSNPLDPANSITQADQGHKVWVGRTTVTLPIVTRHVEQYGGRTTNDGNQAGIFAKIVMNGVDDANFDSSITFFVPIVFSGLPGKS
ncbi:MAG: hypothetical protein JWM80_426 [Cyanobacteria bacterium RYN_339]|nr:hypothetical protein [Cyanobacteria bacterium RYN_339]